MSDLFGEQLLTKNGKKSTDDVLAAKTVIGILFAAEWSPPCRAFVPLLGACYEDIAEIHTDLEIVYVSGDRAQASFDEFYEVMPWAAIPFDENSTKQALVERCSVSDVPALVLIDTKGHLLESNGRAVFARGDAQEIWGTIQRLLDQN